MKRTTTNPLAASTMTSRQRRKERSKRRVPRKTSIEQLENRQLMAADLGFAQGSLLSPEVFEVESAQPTAVVQAPMIETTVHGSLADNADVDFFSIQLSKGDIFTVQVKQAGAGAFGLSLSDAAGQAMDAKFIDPRTGLATDQAFIFHAESDGEFLVGIDSDLVQTTALNYDLQMRTIALHEGYINPQLLDPAVEELLAKDDLRMYTWLDGDKLAVAGPTGHGFEISGEWEAEQTNRLGHLLNQLTVRSDTAEAALNAIVTAVDQQAKSVEELTVQFANDPIVGFLHNGAAGLRDLIDGIVNGDGHTRYTTYTTSGGDLAAAGLLTAMGSSDVTDIAADIVQALLQNVKLEVNVVSTDWDYSFGEIDSINVMLDLGDVELTAGDGINLQAVADDLLAAIPGLSEVVSLQAPIASWGVKLGGEEVMQDLAARFGAPLNSAVPYLHFAAHWALGASVGPLSVEAASAGFAVFVDPADPFVYIGIDNPVGPGGAKAISAHGYMPLQLADHQTPDGWNESFFGHLYVKADGQLTKVVQGEGEIYLDFDADDNGDVTLSNTVVAAFTTFSPIDTILAGAEAAMNLDALPNPVELLAQSAIAVKGKFDINILDLIKQSRKKQDDESETNEQTQPNDDTQTSPAWKGADPENDAKLSASEMSTREASAIDTKQEFQQKINELDQEVASDREFTADELELWKAKRRDMEQAYEDAETEQDYWYQLRHAKDALADEQDDAADENQPADTSEDSDSDAIGSNMELIGTFIRSPSGTYYHGRSALAVKEILGVEIADSGLASGALVTDVQVLADGSFRVRHAGEIHLLGYQLADAELIVTNEGATIKGFLVVPGPVGNIVEAHLSGQIAHGQFFLSGDGQVNLGVASTAARVYLNNAGASASMEVNLVGSMVRVEGQIRADGSYRLQGVTDINLVGMDMAAATVIIDSRSGVTIIADNTAGDSLKNEAAPALRKAANDAQFVMEAAEADLNRARQDVQTLEGRLAAARSAAAAQVAAFSQDLANAQKVVDVAQANKGAMKTWVDREYAAYRSAVTARQQAPWWLYAQRAATEAYRYTRYQTARAAYNSAGTALNIASAALTLVRNDAGWKSLGVDANPEVIRLTAELAISRVALDAATVSLAVLNATGIGEAFENVSGAALNAAAWLAENNGSDLLNVNRLEFHGSIGDLLNKDPGLAVSLDVQMEYTYLGERREWGVAMHTDDLLTDLGNALVNKLS